LLRLISKDLYYRMNDVEILMCNIVHSMHLSRILKIFILLIVISCKNENFDFNASETRILDIPLDSSQSPETYNWKCYSETGKDFLFYFNHSQHEILVFDMDQERLKSKISLTKEGPNGIRQIAGFTVLTLDSILIAPYDCKFYLVDSSGTINKTINYCSTNVNDQEGTTAQIRSHMFNDIYRRDGYFYVPQRPMLRKSDGSLINPLDRLKSRLFIKIAIGGDKKEYLDVFLPSNYFESSKSVPMPSDFTSTMVDNRLFWGFINTPKVYFAALGDEKIQVIDILPDNYDRVYQYRH
jgi:hypothetical protein